VNLALQGVRVQNALLLQNRRKSNVANLHQHREPVLNMISQKKETGAVMVRVEVVRCRVIRQTGFPQKQGKRLQNRTTKLKEKRK